MPEPVVSATIAQQLADFAISTDTAAIPARVRQRAALHLLDTLGCGLAAVATGAAEPATAVALAQGGREEASLLGARAPVPAAVAALANGTRCHALDFDDTHEAGICHSSTVVAPAALATGEARGRSGAELLEAYILGTEVALRVAIGTADGLYARGFHPTSVCGAFGAAAAAARLLALDRTRTTHALGIVGSFAAGLFEYLSDGSQTKPLHAGWAAQSGVQAALLAEAGATGPATVLEGRFGLIASHTDPPATSDGMANTLGETWEIEAISIKPFPACHFVHSSTWAAAAVFDEHGLVPQDVEQIFVRIPPEGEPVVLEPLSAKQHPRTPYDAKFSLPFTVAHHLVHRRLSVSSFSPESIRDPDVLSLARRIRPEPLSGTAPSRFAGGARVVPRSGAELDRFVAHAPGSPGNPLDEEQVLAKFHANAELALDDPAPEELANLMRELDEVQEIGSVFALAQVPEGRFARS
jgi:2-methylcitrate dehydratase PrpD